MLLSQLVDSYWVVDNIIGFRAGGGTGRRGGLKSRWALRP